MSQRREQIRSRLIAGQSPRRIADELGITTQAVYAHIARMSKQVRRRAALLNGSDRTGSTEGEAHGTGTDGN